MKEGCSIAIINLRVKLPDLMSCAVKSFVLERSVPAFCASKTTEILLFRSDIRLNTTMPGSSSELVSHKITLCCRILWPRGVDLAKSTRRKEW